MISRYELFSSCVSCMYYDIQKIQRVEMAKFGLKGPHAQCLLAINRYPEGITAARLCEICEKDKAAISRTIAEMEQAGLVIRNERNGTRYRALLTLTDRGREAAWSVNARAQQAVEQAGVGLDNPQQEVFYRMLGMIADNLHTICKNGLKENKESV